MKKTMFISIVLLLIGTVSMTGCGNDNSSDNNETVVSNLQGEVRFNSGNSMWYLYTVEEGSIDLVKDYYPVELNEAFQEVGMEVMFSGRCKKMNTSDAPVGTESFIITLTSITKKNQ